jgi:TatD DNase family protein
LNLEFKRLNFGIREKRTTAMYVDSHAHLDSSKFDSDRSSVVDRALGNDVKCVLTIGSGEEPLDCAIRIAKEYSWIWATIGIHPHEAKTVTEAYYLQLEKLACHEKVIAWGEIGLDYFYDFSPREVQKAVFQRQMELARAARLPIVIHCRPSNNSENAWDDTIEMLRLHWASSGLGGILHCFTGEWKHAKAALDMGFYLSFAGNVTFPKATNIHAAAKEAPADRFLIETDSPYLAPIPQRGKRNEPAFVVHTAEFLAQLRGLNKEEIGQQTAKNFFTLFPRTVAPAPVLS